MNKTALRFCTAIAAGLLALSAVSCATSSTAPMPNLDIQTLRVGFAPNYPPICMTDADGNPSGLEAEFAANLADELGCGYEIVSLDFKDLFPALLDGRVDIAMAGLTVTPVRAYKVRFCKPYMDNPLVAVTRAGWARSYTSASQVLAGHYDIGVLRDTYAETFVRRHCHRARPVLITDYDAVPRELAENRYSVYIDDLAAVLDISAKHPGDIEVIPYPLQQQEIAWAVSPNNAALLSAANAAVDKWKANGRLDALLDHWVPDRFH